MTDLKCPQCGAALRESGDELLCPTHDRFVLVEGELQSLPSREYSGPKE